jgi:antitoxin component of MazEF toxin-antitoxin module
MNTKGCKVTESGELNIPPEMLRAIGIEHGGDVVVELIGNEIRIRTVAEGLARAQELTRRLLEGKPDSSVDDFIAWRRGEAERE